jgi:hypothetical protein
MRSGLPTDVPPYFCTINAMLPRTGSKKGEILIVFAEENEPAPFSSRKCQRPYPLRPRSIRGGYLNTSHVTIVLAVKTNTEERDA